MRAPHRLGLLAVAAARLLWSADATATTVEACVQASESAQELKDQGKLRAARDELLRCVDDSCPGPVKHECLRLLTEVEARMPSVVFSVRDAAGNDITSVRVSIDGLPLVDRIDGKSVPVDPGEHVFRFEVAAPLERRVTVHESEKGRLLSVGLPAPLPLAPPRATSERPSSTARSRPTPVLTYVLAGTAAVGVAGFVYFWLGAVAEAKNIQQTCAPRCASANLASVRTQALVADISLGVGIASAVAAAGTFFFLRPSRSIPVAISVLPATRGGMVDLAAVF